MASILKDFEARQLEVDEDEQLEVLEEEEEDWDSQDELMDVERQASSGHMITFSGGTLVSEEMHTFHDLPPSTVERRVLTVNEEGRIIAEKRCVCLTRKLIPTNILQHSFLYFRVVASPLIALHTLGVMVCNLQNSRVWFNRSRQSTDVYCSDVMSHVWVGY
ncbi:unnamed protein product [Heligmosomoides polygyrus]|uniref:Spt5-NGN domain-containing protein n=1 Tax=Heligmosomoides polygyrus TaxID=6339 RepID=A0A183GQC6_HELPZ|nr:unnamed protein product [Heligmosomoides polygyrus]